MEPSLESRLRSVEELLAELLARVDALERGQPTAGAEPAARAAPAREPPLSPAAPPPEPRPPEPPPAAPRPPSRPPVELEDLLGGRVLAWLGGLAVFLGAVFFVAMAVRRGWIDESTRVVLAFLVSSLLLGAGVWLYERRGQTEAAVAAVAASIGALYASLTAATQLYELIAPAAGLGVAALVGVAATSIAVRWDSRLVAALGILGALVSPVLVEAGTESVTLAFMALALMSAVGVVVWRRWDWLAFLAFFVSVPQLLAWLDGEVERRLWPALAVLAAFWLVYAVGAVGYELRVPASRLRASSGSLLLLDAVLVAGAGWAALESEGYGDGATGWVVGAAAVHLAVGSASLRGRISREVALLYLAVAIGLSAIAVALALDGPALVAAWSVEAVVLTWLGARSGYRRAYVAAGVLLGLAAAHTLLIDAEPGVVLDRSDDLARPTVAAVLVALAAFLCARLYRGPWPAAPWLDRVAAAAAAYAVAIALDGAWLVAAWSGGALALAWASRRWSYAVALEAAVALVAVAALHTLGFDAPPVALREGADSLAEALVAVAAVAVAAFAVVRLARPASPDLRLALEALGAAAAVYLPSVVIVDLTATAEPLEPGQTPQVLLSAFWSLTGLAAIVLGLLRDDVRFRVGGLVLLGVAVAKVFVYDLAALDEIFRVASFVVLGLLLLSGAYAYARMRRSAGE